MHAWDTTIEVRDAYAWAAWTPRMKFRGEFTVYLADVGFLPNRGYSNTHRLHHAIWLNKAPVPDCQHAAQPARREQRQAGCLAMDLCGAGELRRRRKIAGKRRRPPPSPRPSLRYTSPLYDKGNTNTT